MVTCPSCAAVDRRGYCAPLRCYCAHADCYAVASYVPLVAANVTPIRRTKARASSWDTREESTWIDHM